MTDLLWKLGGGGGGGGRRGRGRGRRGRKEAEGRSGGGLNVGAIITVTYAHTLASFTGLNSHPSICTNAGVLKATNAGVRGLGTRLHTPLTLSCSPHTMSVGVTIHTPHPIMLPPHNECGCYNTHLSPYRAPPTQWVWVLQYTPLTLSCSPPHTMSVGVTIHTSHPIMLPPHNECGCHNFGTHCQNELLILIPVHHVFLNCSMQENTRMHWALVYKRILECTML